jgi:hypothetical protein
VPCFSPPLRPAAHPARPTRPAGIELGYHGCSYGFSHAKDPGVKLQPHWPGEDGQRYDSLVALLYDVATWRPVAWGRLAQKQ